MKNTAGMTFAVLFGLFAFAVVPMNVSAHYGHSHTTEVTMHHPPKHDGAQQPPKPEDNPYVDRIADKIDSIIAGRSVTTKRAFLEKLRSKVREVMPRYQNSPQAMQILGAVDIVANMRLDDLGGSTSVGTPSGDGSIASTTSNDGDYFGAYTIADSTYGTEVEVTIDGNYRTMKGNGLPNHPTGDFPNANNPNTISAQNYSFTMPLHPTKGSTARWQQIIGVAVNSVFLEPETAEVAECTDGTRLKIEAFQDYADLGFDVSNAHVQPQGSYHYHGIPSKLIDVLAADTDGDLVHVGFAADGFPIYYSKSGAYSPSYRLKSGNRGLASSTTCSYHTRGGARSVDANDYNGWFVDDYAYDASRGDLDECNGTTVDGQYMYFVTEDYPYIGRCLFGNANSSFSKR